MSHFLRHFLPLHLKDLNPWARLFIILKYSTPRTMFSVLFLILRKSQEVIIVSAWETESAEKLNALPKFI